MEAHHTRLSGIPGSMQQPRPTPSSATPPRQPGRVTQTLSWAPVTATPSPAGGYTSRLRHREGSLYPPLIVMNLLIEADWAPATWDAGAAFYRLTPRDADSSGRSRR